MTTSQYIERQRALCATTPLLVGFAGYAGSGKDTAAAALTPEATGRQWVTVRISDPIWDALLAVDPLITEASQCVTLRLSSWLRGSTREDVKRHPYIGSQIRTKLEALGRWGRSVSDDFWLDIACRRIRAALDEGKSVIVPDVRHEREAHRFGWDLDGRDFIGVVLWVQRLDVGPVSDDERDVTAWLDECHACLDATLLNDSTPEALQSKVLAALGEYVVAR